MKILFLSRWFPYPPDNGAKLRVYHLLQGLAEVHEVHLLSFIDRPENDAIAAQHTSCHAVQTVQWKEFDPRSLRSAVGLFSLSPRSLIDTYSVEMDRKIQQVLQAQKFDLIITSQWQMNAYRHCFSGMPVLMEEIEVGVPYGQYAYAGSPRARLRSGLTWLKQRRFLQRLLAKGQPCTVVSEQEKLLLKGLVPDNPYIHVIPNGVKTSAYDCMHADPEPFSLIFTGSFRYKPNYDAMVWFLERVFPSIQAQVSGVRLTITGDNAGLHLPHNEAVTLTGFVDDIRPLVARSWASVVPLQTGGGTRLKILEAMALGTPVISTTKGAEGLNIESERHALIADTPEDFAKETVRLLKDRTLRSQIATTAYQLLRERYDWQVIMPTFLSVVEQAATLGRK